MPEKDGRSFSTELTQQLHERMPQHKNSFCLSCAGETDYLGVFVMSPTEIRVGKFYDAKPPSDDNIWFRCESLSAEEASEAIKKWVCKVSPGHAAELDYSGKTAKPAMRTNMAKP